MGMRSLSPYVGRRHGKVGITMEGGGGEVTFGPPGRHHDEYSGEPPENPR